MHFSGPLARSAAIIGVLALLATIAVVARRSTSGVPSPITRVTDGSVVIGVIAGPGGQEAMLVRGLRLWESKIAEAGGVRYQANGRLAALRLEVADSDGTAQGAAGAAADLLRLGANVLVGPRSDAGAAAAAEQARDNGALFLSAWRQPLGIPFDSMSYFLSPPEIGDFRGVLDAFNDSRSSPGDPSSTRVAIVSTKGVWSDRAQTTAELTDARGYTSRLFRTPAGAGGKRSALLRDVEDFRADVVLLSVPYELGRDLASRSRLAGAELVAAAADSVEEVAEDPPPDDLVVGLPWSPSEGLGGPLFPPGTLAEAYEDRFSGDPTYPVAAGVSLGEMLSGGVTIAQSTEMGRVAGAIEQLRIGSSAGLLEFERGEQVEPSSVAVVAGPDGEPRQLWPKPAAPGYELDSLPVSPSS